MVDGFFGEDYDFGGAYSHILSFLYLGTFYYEVSHTHEQHHNNYDHSYEGI